MHIDDELISMKDREVLEDLMTGAINEVHRKVKGPGAGRNDTASQEESKFLVCSHKFTSHEDGHQLVVMQLLEELQRMPGIGQKTAERLSFFLMRGSSEQANKLADAFSNVKDKIILCSQCHGITRAIPVDICQILSVIHLHLCGGRTP